MGACLKAVSVAIGMLLGLPALGILVTGEPLDPFLEFPPITRHVLHAAFSWPIFIGSCLLDLILFLPLALGALKASLWATRPLSPPVTGRFPWWGWLGLGTGSISWFLAWTRFPWFEAFQPHTFTPLWISYILVINALTYRRKGACMMLKRPKQFLVLFPLSGLFWWFFEYLNRFVQNWYYSGIEYGPIEYIVYSSISFSTVLPAVLGTREWLLTFPGFHRAYGSSFRVPRLQPRPLTATVLILSGLGLVGIGAWPDYLFPILWVAPLLIVISLQTLEGRSNLFSPLVHGDWRGIASAALAALCCGGFWEMWNYYSLARWEYAIPFVGRFKIFEMPVLGYGGYLPFGLECVLVAEFLGLDSRTPLKGSEP